MNKVFLSGGISGLPEEQASSWRDSIVDLLESPFTQIINPMHIYWYCQREKATEKEGMMFDLNAVRNCDLVIVNFNDKKSIGTAMELMLAYELQKPIIGICENVERLHPWLQEVVTKFCKDELEASSYALKFYL